MTVKGHIVLAAPIGYFGFNLANDYLFTNDITSHTILFICVYLFAVVLPDIDEPNSYIGRRLPVFSNILSLFIEHRGITHFFIIPLLLFLSSIYVAQELYAKIILFALSLGILAHDIGDMLTKGGIKAFFFPFFRSKTIAILPRFLRFYTGSITEMLVIILILISSIFYLLTKSNFFSIFY